MPSPRSILILALMLLMELLAGFVVVIGIGLLDITGLQYAAFWLLAAVGLAGLGMAIVISATELHDPWNRAALLGAGAVLIAIATLLTSRTWESALALGILLAVVYWRGLVVTQEPPSHAEVQKRFSSGFAILFVGLAAVVTRGIIFQRPVWTMLALLGIAYTVTALVALSAARMEERREPGAAQAVVLAVAMQLGLLVLLGFLAIGLFAFDIGGWLAHVTQPFWNLVGLVLQSVLTVILTPVAWLIEHLRAHAHAPHAYHPPQPVGAAHGNGKRLKARPESTGWGEVLLVVIVLAVLAGIGALIWRTLPRLKLERRERGYREELLSDWSLPALWAALRDWLRGIFRRGSSTAGQAVRAMRRRVLGPVYPTDPVRRLYAQILTHASASGVTRLPLETPSEFERRLVDRWPEGTEDFATLTTAYVQRRYGDVSFADEQIGALKRHWQRVRALMRLSRRARAQGASSGDSASLPEGAPSPPGESTP